MSWFLPRRCSVCGKKREGICLCLKRAVARSFTARRAGCYFSAVLPADQVEKVASFLQADERIFLLEVLSSRLPPGWGSLSYHLPRKDLRLELQLMQAVRELKRLICWGGEKALVFALWQGRGSRMRRRKKVEVASFFITEEALR